MCLQFPVGDLNLLEMLLRIRPQAGVTLKELGIPLLGGFLIGLLSLGFRGNSEGDA